MGDAGGVGAPTGGAAAPNGGTAAVGKPPPLVRHSSAPSTREKVGDGGGGSVREYRRPHKKPQVGTLDVAKALADHQERKASGTITGLGAGASGAGGDAAAAAGYVGGGQLGGSEHGSSERGSEYSWRDEDERKDWGIDPKKLVLKKFIAKGTYGAVFRGDYEGKDVAVKLLDWGEDDVMSRAELTELRNAFRQEVAVWSKLDHPNVTAFYGAVVGGARGFKIPSQATGHDGHMLVDGHVCCVVLEFVPGGTMKDLIKEHRKKKLPYKTVIQLALDTARGLAYLHSKHIVHRDVKSENMLLDKHRRVKIGDFGVSRVENNDDGSQCSGLTGTLGYMAPEVLMEKPYDHKVDVYSFGILMWEIYCCDNPFPFFDFEVKDVQSFVNQGLRPDIPSKCPKDYSDLMRRCWDASPKARPDMVDVVHALEGIDVRKGAGMTPVSDLEALDVKQPSCSCFGALKKLF